MEKRCRHGAQGLAALGFLLGLGCASPEPRDAAPMRLEVNVFADTGRAERLRIVLPWTAAPLARADEVAIWLARVAPARATAIEAPLPEATPAPVDTTPPAPPGLEVDPDLKPPLLRVPGALRVPPGIRRVSVELDVRVAEDGSVTDALWAGGAQDIALVAAATDCALSMRFYPALREGRPVAVWCRQRFDFDRR